MKIRLNLELDPDTGAKLEDLVEKTHGSKTEVIRRAIALLSLVVKAREEGKKFGIAHPERELATEIVVL